MKDQPKISIITPTFNQAKYIKRTINSVIKQNYPNLEYIVVDGGSTDGTVDILRNYSHKIKWVSEKDNGQSDAINKGFRIATGDIFAFINSDDMYEANCFQVVANYFNQHPEAMWVTGKCRIINPNDREIRQLITAYKNYWLKHHKYKRLLVLDYISQPATFWRREVVREIGPFDEKLHFSMDYDFSLRVGRKYKLWFIDEYLACYRIHPDAKAGNIEDHFAADLSIAEKYTKSRGLRTLHWLHNKLITSIYKKTQSK